LYRYTAASYVVGDATELLATDELSAGAVHVESSRPTA
jgi:hypothetical protein